MNSLPGGLTPATASLRPDDTVASEFAQAWGYSFAAAGEASDWELDLLDLFAALDGQTRSGVVRQPCRLVVRDSTAPLPSR